METLEITDYETVYVIWINDDLTEGRGVSRPYQVCESEFSAKRLAKGKGVMGSNAGVRKAFAIKVNGEWLSVVKIITPNDENKKNDSDEIKKLAAVEKAREAGLTDDDIKDLGL